MSIPGHAVNIDRIGETHGTGRRLSERMWNKYYFKSYTHVVDQMLGRKTGVLLDIGTSHGYWLQFFKERGFSRILGIELDSARAQQAKTSGYDDVYNCDATKMPIAAASVDVAVSNDVFVHILELDNKIAVLTETERVLKPGGIFILNHAMSKAFGFEGYRVEGYCSFLTLHELISLVVKNTSLEIRDIKPTYYHFRKKAPSLITRLTRRFISVPIAPTILFALDFRRRLPLEESDAVYVKLEKRGAN